MPVWYAGVAWREADGGAVWRADEMELVRDEPVKPADRRKLSALWWARLNSSLDALAAQHTTRYATPDPAGITQDVVTRVIRRAFPHRAINTAVDRWAPAHADCNWPNLTWPNCYLLDWSDWGTAPYGMDSAKLWVNSLDERQVAEHLLHARQHVLGTRDGKLMALYYCAQAVPYVGAGSPVRREALRLLDELAVAR